MRWAESLRLAWLCVLQKGAGSAFLARIRTDEIVLGQAGICISSIYATYAHFTQSLTHTPSLSAPSSLLLLLQGNHELRQRRWAHAPQGQESGQLQQRREGPPAGQGGQAQAFPAVVLLPEPRPRVGEEPGKG